MPDVLRAPTGATTEQVLRAQNAKAETKKMVHFKNDRCQLPYFCEFPDGIPDELNNEDVAFEPRCDKCCIGAMAFMHQRHPNHAEWAKERINAGRQVHNIQP